MLSSGGLSLQTQNPLFACYLEYVYLWPRCLNNQYVVSSPSLGFRDSSRRKSFVNTYYSRRSCLPSMTSTRQPYNTAIQRYRCSHTINPKCLSGTRRQSGYLDETRFFDGRAWTIYCIIASFPAGLAKKTLPQPFRISIAFLPSFLPSHHLL